jgi:hypothetical protein
MSRSSTVDPLPPLPLDGWRDTKDTLHLYLQIIGKVRLEMMPRQNHWWHVPLYVSPRGFTTRSVPDRPGTGRLFEVELDVLDPAVRVTTTQGSERRFGVSDGLTVAAFYDNVLGALTDLGIEVEIRAEPYDHPSSTTPFAADVVHASFDAAAVERFWRILATVQPVFLRFDGRFTGKRSPVHLFWHSLDLAYTRFSGRTAPPPDASAGAVARDAYSHEVISFGFWAGDASLPEPAFYAYAYPEPDGLRAASLSPDGARWVTQETGSLAVFPYAAMRRADSPAAALRTFLESAYRACADAAGWDRERLRATYAEEARAE